MSVEVLREVTARGPSGQSAKQAAIKAHASQLLSPFPGSDPVLPDHVLDLFADGHRPFFVADPEAGAA